jgi:Mg-chelatase subunit ChlD
MRCARRATDLNFVLDQSGSMTAADDQKARTLVKDLAGAFEVGPGAGDSRLSLVAFSTVVTSVSPFSSLAATDDVVFSRYVDALKQVPKGTGTSTALLAAASQFASAPPVAGRQARTVSVIISDGQPNQGGRCKEALPSKPMSVNALICARAAFATLRGKADVIVLVRIGSEIRSDVFGDKEDVDISTSAAAMLNVVTDVLDAVCVE